MDINTLLNQLQNTTESFTVQDVLLITVLSFVLSLVIGYIYQITYRGSSYSQAYVHTLVIMSMVVAVIMLVIGSNIARAFSLVGALSIIRFRNAMKETRDVGFIFFAMAIGFGVKVPIFPFHTWLPDAHVQAPTAGSIILAGVLLKMGTYGFVRFMLPLFPEAAVTYGPIIAVLAIVGIIYGALVALVQKDIKSLVAYSSVAHLGFVMLGIFALNQQGVSGAVLQMVNHGLSTGALFLMVGMLYERRHTRMMDDYGGLWASVPVFCFFFLALLV